MKKVFSFFILLFIGHAASAQFVAKMEVKGPLPGACDSANVYAMFPGFKGQVAPVAPLSNKELEKKLNNEVKFLKDHPEFEGHLMMHMIINCKGEMIVCEVDNKSGNEELDADVLKVFQSMKKWEPGTLNGNEVDCSVLISMDVKKGKITI